MRIALVLAVVLPPAAAVAGCSAVLPLGDEYTFEESDGSTLDAGPTDGGPTDAPSTDAGPTDAGPTDSGPPCDPIPTEAEACADRCGEVVLCEMSFSCGGCVGELTCGGGGVDNVCGCADAPCAVASIQAGDVDRQIIIGIDVDADGNVFIAGNFRGTITFGGDSHTNPGSVRDDMFLAKLDPEGNPLWSRAYGGLGDTTGANDEVVTALAVDAAGNVVLVGTSYRSINLGGADLAAESDIVIVKLDGDGGHVFSATYPCTSGVSPNDVAIDPASQDIFLTGKFYGTLQFSPLSSMTAAAPGGFFDIFLVRFNPAGVPQRSRHYGDTSEQVAESVAVSGGSVYLSGYFNGDFDFGSPSTTPLSTTSYYSLAITNLNTSFFSHRWSRQYGTSVSSSQIAADASGGLFVSGYFNGTLDITTPAFDSTDGETFVAQLDSDGNTVWAQQRANVWIDDLAVGSDGTLYVVGRANGDTDLGGGPVTGSGGQDAFIAHYAADGTHLWSRVFTAPVGNQRARGVDVAPDGTVWMAAELEGQVDFGTGELTTAGDRDVAAIAFRD